MKTFSIWLPPELVARVDGECEAAQKALPGAKLSRSAWIQQRLKDFFAAKDAKDAKRCQGK